MLRYGQTTVAFDRDDNIATFRRLQDAFQKILDTPEGGTEETLNSECLFCPKKTTCNAITKSISMGSVLSIDDLEYAADLRALLDYQEKAAKAAKAELDAHIMLLASNSNVLTVSTPMTAMRFAASRTRKADGRRVHEIVGDEIFQQYGKEEILVGSFEELLKDTRLTPEQVEELGRAMGEKVGDPYVVTKPKNV